GTVSPEQRVAFAVRVSAAGRIVPWGVVHRHRPGAGMEADPECPGARRHAAAARPASPPAGRTVRRRPVRPQESALSLAAADDAVVSSRHDRLGCLTRRRLFAFCQQTDPELLLLIEARKCGAGYRWEYAVAGFSDMDLYLRLDGREVWRDVPAF